MKITLYGKRGHAYTVAFKNFLNSTDETYIYKDVSKVLPKNVFLAFDGLKITI